jgi:hypothetical protein
MATLFSIITGMGIVVFLLMFSVGAVVTPEALHASTYWGRRVKVPWASITNVTAGSLEGLPLLIIQSEAPKAKLYVFTLGIERQEAHMKLYSMAGPDHLFTKFFK